MRAAQAEGVWEGQALPLRLLLGEGVLEGLLLGLEVLLVHLLGLRDCVTDLL